MHRKSALQAGGLRSRLKEKALVVTAGLTGHLSLREVGEGLFPTLASSHRPRRACCGYDPQAPPVVLSPHLDDAVFSCWSVLSAPGDVQVVNVCAAVPKPHLVGAWDRVTNSGDSASIMQRRLIEDRDALALAGRRSVNLEFRDAQYPRLPPTPQAVECAIGEKIQVASRVYAPAGLGGHPDHLVARELAFLLATRGIPVCLYAELPYAIGSGWPASVTEPNPGQALKGNLRWESDLASSPWPPEALHPRVRVLNEERAAAKLAAMQTYRTQFSALNERTQHLLSDPSVIRYEVYWYVSEPVNQ